jgi:tetratricopeptide (TPR) repeat protein
MSDQNESVNTGDQRSKAIEAIVFEAPDASAQIESNFAATRVGRRQLLTRNDAPWWHSQFNLMFSVFGLLVLAASLLIVLSPEPNSLSSSNTLVSAQGEATQLAQAVVKANSETAPWDESRDQQARTDSQDILSQLLSAKKDLEAKKVLTWGESGYQSALAKAAIGDELYKVKDFQNAIASYQAALDEMQSLEDLIPDVLATLVAEGNLAIDRGKTDLAREKFKAAINLDRNNIPALTGIDRAGTLDQVLAIMRQAALDEEEFKVSDDIEHLQLAAEKYAQVLQLDSRTQEANSGAQRVSELNADKRFRDAMTDGFSALFDKSYRRAKKGFSEALKIKPNDQAASSAYRQSLASDKRSSLSAMLASGKRLERTEEWASALSTYQAVLQRDPNQVAATVGKIRARARKQLDESLKEVLFDTLALARSSQRNKAEGVLGDAKRIKAKGPILTSQIAEIEASLKQIDSSIKVSFTSDGLTNVDLIKLGSKKIRLGKFSVKNLALKPGRYVINGARLGFKDERREIELRVSNAEVQTISIACKTPVTGTAVVTN